MHPTIENDGSEIGATNYWEMPLANQCPFYLSFHEHTFRLLIPQCQERYLHAMDAARGCAVSRGPRSRDREGFEVLFDNDSKSPFALHTYLESLNAVPPDTSIGYRSTLTVWVEGPRKRVAKTCVYRRAPSLPDLRPWFRW